MKKLLISSVSVAAMMAAASIAVAEDKGPGAGAGGGAGPGAQAPAARDFGGGAGNGQSGGAAGAQPDRGGPAGAPSADKSKPSAQDMGRDAEATGDKLPDQQRAKERTAKDGGAKRKEPENGASGAGSGESGKAASDSAASDSKSAESKQGGAHVTLNADQRSRVNSAFKGHKGSAGVSVNVDVRIGTRLPRSIALVAIPSDVIVVVPDWRRYKFIVVGDTVCIVDPDTFEIVDVIVIA
jgi:opacity protein-like surface antigen